MSGIDNRITILLGHTRWRTRGDERVNRNNHPIRAGDIIRTFNGTTYNAVRDDRIDMERFRARLELCRGQIAAVLASRLDPEPSSFSRGTSLSNREPTAGTG